MDAPPRRRRSRPENAPAVAPSCVRIMDDKRNASPPVFSQKRREALATLGSTFSRSIIHRAQKIFLRCFIPPNYSLRSPPRLFGDPPLPPRSFAAPIVFSPLLLRSLIFAAQIFRVCPAGFLLLCKSCRFDHFRDAAQKVGGGMGAEKFLRGLASARRYRGWG